MENDRATRYDRGEFREGARGVPLDVSQFSFRSYVCEACGGPYKRTWTESQARRIIGAELADMGRPEQCYKMICLSCYDTHHDEKTWLIWIDDADPPDLCCVTEGG